MNSKPAMEEATVETAGKNLLPGSERPRADASKLVKPVDDGEKIAITLLIRFPPGCPPLPDLEYWQKTPLNKRHFLSPSEHAARYGATKADLDKVLDYVQKTGMTVLEYHGGRRTVCIQGTAGQLNATFGIKLCHYESPLPYTPRQAKDEEAHGGMTKHTHYGFDGPVYLRDEISEIVTAVVGLDNRRVSVSTGKGSQEEVRIQGPAGLQAGGTGDPSTTGSAVAVPLDVTTVAQYYNFPNSGASDQVIGIVAPQQAGSSGYGSAYGHGDITAYIASLPAAYQTPPTLKDIPLTVGSTTYNNSSTYVDQINSNTNFSSYPYSYIIELTQDISTSSTIAQGATINVYFTEDSEQGWMVYLNHVLVPPAGEKTPSVMSSSFIISARGFSDDTLGPLTNHASTGYIMTTLYQQLAGVGIHVFQAQGDWGADDSIIDGKRHVAYAGTDPYVTSCGGTVLNLSTTPSPLEWVWSDSWSTTSNFGPGAKNPSDFGSTGGGASGLFLQTPPYQSSAGITSITDSGRNVISGARFVPDVAGMVGYSAKFLAHGVPYNFIGTSCVAPTYAGLTAVVQQAFGIPLGFLNPTFYTLGETVFNDITIGTNDSVDNPDSTFFTASAGWDPCTGWGSIDGNKLINGIANLLFTQTLYLQGDKLSFGLDEVRNNLLYPTAFWVVVEGFTPNAVGTQLPTLVGTGPFAAGASFVSMIVGSAIFELSKFPATPQRIMYPCSIQFLPSAINTQAQPGIFPPIGSPPVEVTVSASFLGLSNSVVFELVGGSDPYFLNINPSERNVFYLSQDLRVFTITPGITNTPIDGPSGPQINVTDPTTWDSTAGYQYIGDLVNWFNGKYSDPLGGVDPFETVLPNQSGAFSGDSSVTAYSIDPNNTTINYANYNFALARVRLNGSPGATTDSNVRVFFRLFLTQSNDTDYDPSTDGTYAANFDGQGNPISPLVGGGATLTTIPFFATGNYQPNGDYKVNVDYSANSVNNTPITIGLDGSVWQYYGCYLNIYAPNNVIGSTAVQANLTGTHHCLVAQISFDETPIPVTANGVTQSPESNSQLAQRNLQYTPSDNPGPASTHRIPQTFDTRPSAPFDGEPGTLLNYPDELMIDWGNTPIGSTASIYWPAVNANDVLAIAKKLYSTHQLSAADPNTIQCTVPNGITYVPIPTGSENVTKFGGLFTVDLPTGIVRGQEFIITVRRISSRQFQAEPPPPPPPQGQIRAVSSRTVNWRYIVGTFEVRIPVTTGDVMLGPEEDTLAIMKWRLQQMSTSNRWYPVLQRYISYIAGRVDGLGGVSGSVIPSPTGANPVIKPVEYTGKVAGIIYDQFGDFDGFLLWTERGKEKKFKSKEKNTESVIRFAWEKRALISVFAEELVGPLFPVSIVLRRLPNHEEFHC